MNGMLWELLVALCFGLLAAICFCGDQNLAGAAAAYEAWSWFKEAPAADGTSGDHL